MLPALLLQSHLRVHTNQDVRIVLTNATRTVILSQFAPILFSLVYATSQIGKAKFFDNCTTWLACLKWENLLIILWINHMHPLLYARAAIKHYSSIKSALLFTNLSPCQVLVPPVGVAAAVALSFCSSTRIHHYCSAFHRKWNSLGTFRCKSADIGYNWRGAGAGMSPHSPLQVGCIWLFRMNKS